MARVPFASALSATGPGPALRTLRVASAGLKALEQALSGEMRAPFEEALGLIGAAEGRVVVTGMGKSGHVGTKIAATLASTGTPALFVHPAEASHGDLGMITRDDVVLAFSWSGETAELRSIVLYAKRFRVPFIAVTAGAESTLAKAADVALILPKVEEACPHGLAPTTSTLIQMVLGDALAIALLEARGFTADDFLQFHPGGTLGANLTHVRDVMHAGDRLPLAPLGTRMKRGAAPDQREGLRLSRRHQRQGRACRDRHRRRSPPSPLRRDLRSAVENVMTQDPKTVHPDALVASALEILNAASITALLVVERKKPVGIVHMHDLLRTGVA